MLADSLAKLLAELDVLPERATREQGAATVRVLVPDLIVLAGDAAQERGAAVRAQLATVETDRPIATLVIAARELGGLTPQPAPRHVGFLGLEGGISECARRVRAVADLYFEEGLTTCSLQQLADTVAPRVKPPASPVRAPAHAGTAGGSTAMPGQGVAAAVANLGQTTSAATPALSSFAEKTAAALAMHGAQRAQVGTAAAIPSATIAEKAGAPRATQQTKQLTSTRDAEGHATAGLTPKEAADKQQLASHPSAVAAAAQTSLKKKQSKASTAGAQAAQTRQPTAVKPAATLSFDARSNDAGVRTDSTADGSAARSAPTPKAEEPSPPLKVERAAVATVSFDARTNDAGARTDLTADGSAAQRAQTPKTEDSSHRSNLELAASAILSAEAPANDTGVRNGGPATAARDGVSTQRARTAAKLPAVERSQSTASEARRVATPATASPKLASSPKQSVSAVSLQAASTTVGRAEPAKTEPRPRRDSPLGVSVATKAESMQGALSRGQAAPALPSHRDPAPSVAPPEAEFAVALREPAPGGTTDVDARMRARPASEPLQPASRVAALQSEVVISLSDRAPDSGSPHDALVCAEQSDPEIAVSFSEPAPRPASTHQGLASTAHSEPEVVVSRNAPPPLRRSQHDASPQAAHSEPEVVVSRNAPPPLRRSQRDASPLAAAVEPEVAVSRNAPPPLRRSQRDASPLAAAAEPEVTFSVSEPAPPSTSKRAAFTGAAPAELEVTISVSEPAPGPVSDIGAPTAARSPKLRRVADPFAGPQASIPQQHETPWLPLPGVAQANAASPRAQGALAALQAAHAAAVESPPWTTRSSSTLRRAAVYVAVVGCCLLPAYLWFAQSSKKVDVEVALGSLGAGNFPPSSSAASNRARPQASRQTANTQASRTSTAKHSGTPATSSRSEIDANQAFDPSGATRESAIRESMSRAEQLVDEGSLLIEDGRLGLAEASYLKALNVVPSYPRAMAGLVRVHIERKDGAEAVRWAKQLVAKQPKNGQHQLLLGDAQALRGDTEAARAAWNQAVRYGNFAARQRLSASPDGI